MSVPSTQSRALERIRADVRAMSAYHVQPSQGLLKMDTMENPFRLPAALQQALGGAISPRSAAIVADSNERLRAAMLLGSPDFMQH